MEYSRCDGADRKSHSVAFARASDGASFKNCKGPGQTQYRQLRRQTEALETYEGPSANGCVFSTQADIDRASVKKCKTENGRRG